MTAKFICKIHPKNLPINHKTVTTIITSVKQPPELLLSLLLFFLLFPLLFSESNSPLIMRYSMYSSIIFSTSHQTSATTIRIGSPVLSQAGLSDIDLYPTLAVTARQSESSTSSYSSFLTTDSSS